LRSPRRPPSRLLLLQPQPSPLTHRHPLPLVRLQCCPRCRSRKRSSSNRCSLKCNRLSINHCSSRSTCLSSSSNRSLRSPRPPRPPHCLSSTAPSHRPRPSRHLSHPPLFPPPRPPSLPATVRPYPGTSWSLESARTQHRLWRGAWNHTWRTCWQMHKREDAQPGPHSIVCVARGNRTTDGMPRRGCLKWFVLFCFLFSFFC